MTSYRLHYFPESGNSYKPALRLTLCGQSFEPIWTDFGGGVTRTPGWRATVNEMGEIPVLEGDGVRLTQTAPILLQLAARHGRFGGRSAAQKFEILRWLFWDNHKLTGYMATYRYLRTFTPKPDPKVLAFLRKRIDDYLSILDQHLQRSAFAVGDEPTVADISMMAYLHYPSDETGYIFEDSHPAVHAWLGRMAQFDPFGHHRGLRGVLRRDRVIGPDGVRVGAHAGAPLDLESTAANLPQLPWQVPATSRHVTSFASTASSASSQNVGQQRCRGG